MLPRAECGDLRDHVESVRGGSRARGGDSELGDVKGGACSEIGSANESHWSQW